jgi:predicted  nucleic acid-binding Zn-ribbon protein
MTNTNYPSASPTTTPQRSSNSKNIVIGLLAVALLGSWAYFLMKINRSDKDVLSKTEEGVHYMSQRDSLENLYKFTLDKYDSVTVANNDLSGKLTGKQTEITKLKVEINSILKKKNATQSELARAKTLIDELNTQIETLQADNARLTGENQTLTAEKTQLTTEKETLQTDLNTTKDEKKVLEQTVDVASTFSASNIAIIPINEKNGGKEKETTTAKKVDKLVVSFDVENRIAKSGPADMYVMVTAPDGKVISTENVGGTFTTREEGDKTFTSKITVNYEQGKRQNVQLPLIQDKFQTGDYKIQVYHNGFKIGEGVRTLKKGGLF